MIRTCSALAVALAALLLVAGCRSSGPRAGVKMSSFAGARSVDRDIAGLASESAAERIWSIQRLAAHGRIDMSRRIAMMVDRNHEHDPAVRSAAASAVGRLGDAKVSALVARGVDDPDALVRVASIRALGRLGDKNYIDSLLEIMLSDAEPLETRVEAALALGDIGDMKPVPDLIDTLGAPETSMAFAARRALARLTGEDFGMDTLEWRSWWNEHR